MVEVDDDGVDGKNEKEEDVVVDDRNEVDVVDVASSNDAGNEDDEEDGDDGTEVMFVFSILLAWPFADRMRNSMLARATDLASRE